MALRERTRPELGIIEPCLPSPAKAPPSGRGWIREIKHDGFRIMARRDGAAVRLITRHGNDFTARFKVHLLLHRTTCITLTLKPCCLIFIYELA
jgi:ATP-dependent DNA ligase